MSQPCLLTRRFAVCCCLIFAGVAVLSVCSFASPECDDDAQDCWSPWCWDGGKIRWRTLSPWYEVPFYVHDNAEGDWITDGGLTGIEAAASTWSGCHYRFQLDYQGLYGYQTNWNGLDDPPNDNLNVLGWSATWTSDPWHYYSSGVTFSRPYGTNVYLDESDTFFNCLTCEWAYFPSEPGPGWSGVYDVESVALHEFGHWLAFDDLYDSPYEPLPGYCTNGLCGGDQPCVMCLGTWGPDIHIRRDVCDDEYYGVGELYAWTSVGDLRSFSATPGDGFVDLSWLMWFDKWYSFKLYASEAGRPFVLLYSLNASGLQFTYRDAQTADDVPYTYVLWVDDGFSGYAYATPSGASPLAEYSDVSCTEVQGGLRVSWTTLGEQPSLSGFDIYRGDSCYWRGDGTRYVDTFSKINAAPIAPAHAPHTYEFNDDSARHGHKHSYLVKALSASDVERAGPAWNPCWHPLGEQSSLQFATGQSSCPCMCPAGDIGAGRAPIRLELTIRDSCGYRVPEYADARVHFAAPSEDGEFALCCYGTQSTVLSQHTMATSAPTDAAGKAWVDAWWAGGGDPELQITAYVEDGDGLPTQLETRATSPDLNADCLVGVQDFALFSSYYGTTAWQADFNCSGTVNIQDFAVFSAHYGHSCGSARTLPIPPELLATLGTGDPAEPEPQSFSLLPNVPNPFNPLTEISYTVPAGGSHVSVSVFNLGGRLTRTLVDEDASAGVHTVVWDGTDEEGRRVPSGVYFYRIDAPGFTERRTMLLLK